MSFCHLDLDSPTGTCPQGAFGGAIPDPEAALYDGDKSGLWGQTQHILI